MSYSVSQRLLAGSVHAFTSLGIVAGFLALLAVAEHRWQEVALWLMVAQIIDGIDGTFARLLRVHEVLPNWDGKMIDYVVDFTTYAVVPAYFIYESGIIPVGLQLFCASFILLTSALYYGKEGMVSDDYYFVGFPVMWNIVSIYLFFVVHLSAWANFACLMVLCILQFVPIKCPYPSRRNRFASFTIFISTLLVASTAGIVWLYPHNIPILQMISLLCMLYYLFISLYFTFNTPKVNPFRK